MPATAKKGTLFFKKKDPKNFTTPYSPLIQSNQNRFFHDFCKRGQHLLSELQKMSRLGPDK